MKTVFRVLNYDTHEVLFFGNKPSLRKYLVEVKGPHDEMDIREYDITYKRHLVDLLNQTFKFGQSFGDWNFDELFEGSKYAPEYECGGIPRDEPPPPHAYITP